jgi:ribose 5-phosphate isomerase B
VTSGDCQRGVLICGTGIGMTIAANKYAGIRAANCFDEVTAEISRRHNNANVLCLPGDFLGDRPVAELIRVWLETEFAGGRHQRRLEQISAIEAD